MADALLEHWSPEPAGSGTRVTWTFAVDLKLWFRLGLAAAPGVMERVFRTAMRNLERRLSA